MVCLYKYLFYSLKKTILLFSHSIGRALYPHFIPVRKANHNPPAYRALDYYYRIIGSIVITVPAAAFLLADSPKKPAHAEVHMPTHKDPEEPDVSEKQAVREAEEEEEKGKTEPERGSAPSQRESDQPVRGSMGEPDEPSEDSTASESVKAAEDGSESGSAENIESEKKEVR